MFTGQLYFWEIEDIICFARNLVYVIVLNFKDLHKRLNNFYSYTPFTESNLNGKIFVRGNIIYQTKNMHL